MLHRPLNSRNLLCEIRQVCRRKCLLGNDLWQAIMDGWPHLKGLSYRFILTSQALLWYPVSMAIDLPPDLEQSVQRHMSSGQYHSAEDVLRAALHQFDEMDVVSLKHSAVDETAGRVVSLQSVVSVIRQKHNLSETR